jgi:TRAP-type C4-dicarboxylate transport system permease small subunit
MILDAEATARRHQHVIRARLRRAELLRVVPPVVIVLVFAGLFGWIGWTLAQITGRCL